MDVTSTFAMLSKANPMKGIKMFSRWFLRKEIKILDDKIVELQAKLTATELDAKNKISELQTKLEARELELNLKSKTFCPVCKVHSMKETLRTSLLVMYQCSSPSCTFQQSYEEKTPALNVSQSIIAQRANRPTHAIGTGEVRI